MEGPGVGNMWGVDSVAGSGNVGGTGLGEGEVGRRWEAQSARLRELDFVS